MNRIDLKRFPVTTCLMVISIVYYFFTTAKYGFSMNAYDAINSGAFVAFLVKDLHQYYRLITANFVHFGIMHIVFNMISLYNIGPFVEYQFKRYEYIMIIVTSMITTNLYDLFNYAINGEIGYVSGGISGVIFGLLGAILVLGFVYKGMYQRVVRSLAPSLILMLFISISIPNISLSGHLGGLLGGMAVTYYLLYMRQKNYN